MITMIKGPNLNSFKLLFEFEMINQFQKYSNESMIDSKPNGRVDSIQFGSI